MGIYGENLPKLEMKNGMVAHDALNDAINQALWVIDTWKNRNNLRV
jgi:hypothetical protein